MCTAVFRAQLIGKFLPVISSYKSSNVRHCLNNEHIQVGFLTGNSHLENRDDCLLQVNIEDCSAGGDERQYLSPWVGKRLHYSL